MTIQDRVQQRLNELGKKPKPTSIEAGLNETFIRDYLTGRTSKISVENLEKLALALETSFEWLRTGVDPTGAIPPQTGEVVSLMQRMNAERRRKYLEIGRVLSDEESDDEAGG
ncbi:MAG: helix-turn-helix transcriptional regulator [Pseudomonadota bacterium]